jgi:protein SCO1/2
VKRIWLYTLGVAALAAAGIGAYTLGTRLQPAPEYVGTPLTDPPRVTDVTLVQVDRGEVSLSAYEGQYLLMFFGYTRCPDVCPFTLARLAKLYRDLGEPGDVQVVMVTIDPEVDTPELVQSYLAGFHPDFLGFSGDQDQISEAASTFFIGFSQLSDTQFAHTDVVALLDKQGRMQLIYGQDRIPAIADDLAQIRARGRF